jgi:hypothetical protein
MVFLDSGAFAAAVEGATRRRASSSRGDPSPPIRPDKGSTTRLKGSFDNE